jgi:hypothetical protein
MRCGLRTVISLICGCLPALLAPGGPAHAEIEVLRSPVEIDVRFPGEVNYELELGGESAAGGADWSGMSELRVSVSLPDDAPRGTTILCYLKDSQWNWYQHEPSGTLRSGKTNQIRIEQTGGAKSWLPRGHSREWDGYVARGLKHFGVKLFNSSRWSGKIRIERIYGLTSEEPEAPLAVTDLRLNADKIPCFEKFEMTFDLTRVYENPFDPEQVDVRAKFTSPSGRTCEQFAFYYSDYVRRQSPLGFERLTPVGKSSWKVRWTPTEVGKWKVELHLWDQHQQKEWKKAVAEAENSARDAGKKAEIPPKDGFFVRVRPYEFECTPSGSHGFLGVDPKDGFYFSYQDGTFFYPVGQMLRSPVDLRPPYDGYPVEPPEGEGTFAFERMMKKLSDNGVNFIRMWMGIWWVGLEAPRDYAPGYEGLGRYNMENAWKLDHILEQAHALGLKIKLNLFNHGQLTRNIDHEWYENCYSRMNGGMLARPSDFWTDQQAKEYCRRRLRYIVARWAYSPDILGWELWNEVDLTEDFDAGPVVAWHREFARYLKQIDPWKHAISTHFCKDEPAEPVYSLPEIEFTPGDLYQNNVVAAMRRVWLMKKDYGKATFISEYGMGSDADQMEANFHGGLWSSTVVPMAGTAMFWWWNFVDDRNLYFHYKPVALFNEGEDRRQKSWRLTSARVRHGEERHEDLAVLGRQNQTEAHLWVYDTQVFSRNDGERYRRPPAFVGSVLVVPGLESARYRVEFWDTYSGKVTETQEVDFTAPEAADSRDFRVPLPKVQADLAVKIKRIGK